jgi:hypothetical protein
MRTRLALLATLVLVGLPAGALAAKPTHPTKPTPTVLYVLRGSLSHYTAASATSKGSITITVKNTNLESSKLAKMTLTFALDAKTKVLLHKDKPIADGDRGIVKLHAPMGSTATQLQTHTAFELIDQGTSR